MAAKIRAYEDGDLSEAERLFKEGFGYPTQVKSINKFIGAALKEFQNLNSVFVLNGLSTFWVAEDPDQEV